MLRVARRHYVPIISGQQYIVSSAVMALPWFKALNVLFRLMSAVQQLFLLV